MSLSQIRIDSSIICEIYNEYAELHKGAESIKKQIKALEDKLSEFHSKTQHIREQEESFYNSISKKYNVPVEEVKKFVGDAILRIKTHNE